MIFGWRLLDQEMFNIRGSHTNFCPFHFFCFGQRTLVIIKVRKYLPSFSTWYKKIRLFSERNSWKCAADWKWDFISPLPRHVMCKRLIRNKSKKIRNIFKNSKKLVSLENVTKIQILLYMCRRLGICRDRRDRRSCKIVVSCVNFSRKQRSFLHILQVYTHLNVNFLHNS